MAKEVHSRVKEVHDGAGRGEVLRRSCAVGLGRGGGATDGNKQRGGAEALRRCGAARWGGVEAEAHRKTIHSEGGGGGEELYDFFTL